MFSLNQHVFSLSQLHFSTMYGNQAGHKKKIDTHLGLIFHCITYVLYMYRYKVACHSWGRDLLWAG